ncbi:phosphoribosylanthranilate isomerase, partial [Campylobacter jejuni]
QNVFVWQVISVENSLDLKSEIFANLVLFDAKGILKGGNGISFDWTLLGSYTKDFILAGGIGLDNIHKAVQTGAKILDLNSKLEDEKGLKDINKIKQILKELKK